MLYSCYVAVDIFQRVSPEGQSEHTRRSDFRKKSDGRGKRGEGGVLQFCMPCHALAEISLTTRTRRDRATIVPAGAIADDKSRHFFPHR